jgi:hypothetical protein
MAPWRGLFVDSRSSGAVGMPRQGGASGRDSQRVCQAPFSSWRRSPVSALAVSLREQSRVADLVEDEHSTAVFDAVVSIAIRWIQTVSHAIAAVAPADVVLHSRIEPSESKSNFQSQIHVLDCKHGSHASSPYVLWHKIALPIHWNKCNISRLPTKPA